MKRSLRLRSRGKRENDLTPTDVRYERRRTWGDPPPPPHQEHPPFPHRVLLLVDSSLLQKGMVQLHICAHVSWDEGRLHSAAQLDSVQDVHAGAAAHSAPDSSPGRRMLLQSSRGRVLLRAPPPLHKQSRSSWDLFPTPAPPRLSACAQDLTLTTSCILPEPQRGGSYLNVAPGPPRPLSWPGPAHVGESLVPIGRPSRCDRATPLSSQTSSGGDE